MSGRQPARELGTAFLRHIVTHDRPQRWHTGLPHLDGCLRGIHARQLLVVGGPTGAAKTGLAERLALNLASLDVPVTFCQLELPEQSQRERFLAKLHGMSIDGFYRDLRHEVEEYADAVRETIAKLDALPLHLVADDPERPHQPAGWRSPRACFEAAWRNGSKVLVIDHARELDRWLDGRTKDGKHAATEVAKEIDHLTRASGLAVILAHQIAVDPTRRKHRPVKEEFMDTRALAQKADAVVIVHRPFRGLGAQDRVAELIVDKNRNGPEGIVHVEFLPASIDFAPMSREAAHDAECCRAANEKRRKAIEGERVEFKGPSFDD